MHQLKQYSAFALLLSAVNILVSWCFLNVLTYMFIFLFIFLCKPQVKSQRVSLWRKAHEVRMTQDERLYPVFCHLFITYKGVAWLTGNRVS